MTSCIFNYGSFLFIIDTSKHPSIIESLSPALMVAFQDPHLPLHRELLYRMFYSRFVSIAHCFGYVQRLHQVKIVKYNVR